MKELLKKLNNEYAYVYTNVRKCEYFIKFNGVNFRKLSKRAKFLLRFQLFVMKIYIIILNKRIKIIEEAEIKTKGGKIGD